MLARRTHHAVPTKLLSSKNCLSCDSFHTRTVLSREAVMTPSGVVITPLTCASAREVSVDQSAQCVWKRSAALTSSSCPRSSARKWKSSAHCMPSRCLFRKRRGASQMRCALCVCDLRLLQQCFDGKSSIRVSLSLLC